ncbi:MAG: CoA transferase [Oscillospiraceae bacterium]
MPIEANENPSFDLFNGGKEFMHMDLNDPEHERVLHNMLAKADVFLTSMRLGGLKKHNLDYDTLKEKYPRLVMAHATGYGCKDGPLSAAPGLDAVAFFAMNGLISDLRLNPDDSPICPPTGMGDLTTGMPLFGAIMTALFARERTGKGDYVSASLYGNRQLGHIRDQLRHAVLQPLAALLLSRRAPWARRVRDEGRQVRADLRQ